MCYVKKKETDLTIITCASSKEKQKKTNKTTRKNIVFNGHFDVSTPNNLLLKQKKKNKRRRPKEKERKVFILVLRNF